MKNIEIENFRKISISKFFIFANFRSQNFRRPISKCSNFFHKKTFWSRFFQSCVDFHGGHDGTGFWCSGRVIRHGVAYQTGSGFPVRRVRYLSSICKDYHKTLLFSSGDRFGTFNRFQRLCTKKLHRSIKKSSKKKLSKNCVFPLKFPIYNVKIGYFYHFFQLADNL